MSRIGMLAVLILNLTVPPVAHSGPPANAQIEIDYLLGYIKSSGCEFYRNGGWYDATHAQAHLRYKYEAVASRKWINTAEDFIDAVATKSSFSGRAYEVRCGSAATVASSRWLRDALARYRAIGAPRVMRGAPEIDGSGLGGDLSRPF